MKELNVQQEMSILQVSIGIHNIVSSFYKN